MRTDGLQLEIGESDFLDACYFRMHRPEREGKKKQGKEKRWSPYELDSRSFNRESTLRFWVSVQLDNTTAVHCRVGLMNLI